MQGQIAAGRPCGIIWSICLVLFKFTLRRFLSLECLDLPSSSSSSSCPRRPCPGFPCWSGWPRCWCWTCFPMNAAVLSAGLGTTAVASLWRLSIINWFKDVAPSDSSVSSMCLSYLEQQEILPSLDLASRNMFQVTVPHDIFTSKTWLNRR